MNPEEHPDLLTEDDQERLVEKMADAYKRTETPESEWWVRLIAQKISRILSRETGGE